MARPLLLLCSGLLILSLATGMSRGLAQTTQPEINFQFDISNSRDVKFPDVSASRATDLVAVSGTVNRADATAWTKTTTANSFSGPSSLGTSNDGKFRPDDATTTVAVANDGTVHVAWLDQPSNAIRYRNRPPGQDFGPTRTTVSGGGDFRVGLDIGVTTDNVIIIAWRVPDEPMQYQTSRDGGASWSEVQFLSSFDETFGFNIPVIATGPNNQAIIAYGVGFKKRDGLEVFVSTWNGNGFNAPVSVSGGGEAADPSAAISGTGVAYVAWRSVSGGVFFAERQANGSWPPSRLATGEVFGRVSITADTQNNISVTWIANVGGPLDVFFAYRPNGGNFNSTALTANVPGGSVFNVHSSMNIVGSRSYTHAVAENFGGSGLAIRYLLFSGAATPSLNAVPVIENNAERTNKTSLSVSFTNVEGSPTEVRWRFGAAPTDTSNDSDGWKSFTNPLTVTVPNPNDTITCQPLNLFTQVRNAQATQPNAVSDAIVLDSKVQTSVALSNPFMAGRPTIFTPFAAELSDVAGASDGDAGYTRVPFVFMQLSGSSDCSGISGFAVSQDGVTFGSTYRVTNNSFSNIVLLPNAQLATNGTRNLSVRINDGLDNTLNFTRVFTYDTVAPVLQSTTAATVTLQSLSQSTTILTRVSFRGITVTDNLYPAPGYWGLWMANSRTPITSTTALNNLIWESVRVRTVTGNSFAVDNWSVTANLPPAQWTPGTYYVYIRFLDGAGNASAQVLAAQINIPVVTRPVRYLPAIIR